MELDLLPHFVVDIFGVVFVFEQFDAFLDAIVIGGNALACQRLQAMPVGRFEERFGMDRGVAEDPVVPIESFEHRLGNVEADL